MDKKISGAVAAAVAAILFGGSQIFDHEARIQSLEEAAAKGAQDVPEQPGKSDEAEDQADGAEEQPEPAGEPAEAIEE